MGDIVRGSYPTTKPEFNVTSAANNNDDIVNGVPITECAIVIADSVDRSRQMEIMVRLKQCADALLEVGYPVPAAAGNRVVASVSIDGARADVQLTPFGTGVSDGRVAVVYGGNFIATDRPAGTDTELFTSHIKRLMEAWLERVGKSLTGS